MSEETRNTLRIIIQNLPEDPDRLTFRQLSDAIWFARWVLASLVTSEDEGKVA